MSGICGIFSKDRSVLLKPEHLMPMVKALDIAGGNFNDTLTFDSVGFGVVESHGTKTSLTKTSTNGQSFALAFHGNLYNLKEICTDEYDGKDDTNELLRLYLRKGISFLEDLRGEFAISLWDGKAGTLYLATDRFRVHPLFYYEDPEKIVFASRIRGITGCPMTIQRSIDSEAVVDLVASSAIYSPKTIFHEIKKIEPGHVLTYKDGESATEPYWDINFLYPSSAGKHQLARKLKICFSEAVSVRLAKYTSSNSVGTFLSGGVDSSALTGVLAELSQQTIKSFSIGFKEERFNEINYARIAAQAFGVEHFEYFVTPEDTLDAIPVMLDAFDEPFANASAVPTYFCTKIAKEHGVDILFAGDGGDELFAGNERYSTRRVFEYYQNLPRIPREHILEPVVFALADGTGIGIVQKAKKFIQNASIPYPDRVAGLFKIIPIAEFFDAEFIEQVGKDYNHRKTIRFQYDRALAKKELDRQLYIDLKLSISDNDLFKVTRMSEAAGVKVHFPFLDHKLAEFAAGIPAHIKMRGLELRSFFKNTYADLLPQEVRKKTKHGFGLPIPLWLRTEKPLNEMMHELILSPRSIQRGYFRKKTLDKIVNRHKTDETSFYGTILWNLMMLELWLRKYN